VAGFGASDPGNGGSSTGATLGGGGGGGGLGPVLGGAGGGFGATAGGRAAGGGGAGLAGTVAGLGVTRTGGAMGTSSSSSLGNWMSSLGRANGNPESGLSPGMPYKVLEASPRRDKEGRGGRSPIGGGGGSGAPMGGGGGNGASSSSSNGDEPDPVGCPQRGQNGGRGARESLIWWPQFEQLNMWSAPGAAIARQVITRQCRFRLFTPSEVGSRRDPA
jgi:hypothetical protein